VSDPCERNVSSAATEDFAAFVKREMAALGEVTDAWLALSPAGRAFILPSLIKYEEAHRDDT